MTPDRTSRRRVWTASAEVLLGLGLAVVSGCSGSGAPVAKTGAVSEPQLSALGSRLSAGRGYPTKWGGGAQRLAVRPTIGPRAESREPRAGAKRPQTRLSSEGEAALRQGVVALDQGRARDAALAFQRAVRSDPTSGLARDYLGIADLQQGRLEAALRQFREEARLEPGSAVPWARMADAHLAQRDLKHAVQALERGVQLDPENAQLHFNLGVLYPRYLQLARGVASLRRCVALEPENDHARSALADLLMKTGQLEEAQREIERVLAVRPDAGEYQFALGRLLLQRRATPETTARALGALDRALSLGVEEPARVDYYRGLCLQRQERWTESVTALQTAVALAPEAWSAHHALATSLLKLRRSAEARMVLARFRELRERENARLQRSFFEQEVDRNRDEPDAFCQLGRFLESRGDVLGAARALRLAAELPGERTMPLGERLRLHRCLEGFYRRHGLRPEAEAERKAIGRLERTRAG